MYVSSGPASRYECGSSERPSDRHERIFPLFFKKTNFQDFSGQLSLSLSLAVLNMAYVCIAASVGEGCDRYTHARSINGGGGVAASKTIQLASRLTD